MISDIAIRLMTVYMSMMCYREKQLTNDNSLQPASKTLTSSSSSAVIVLQCVLSHNTAWAVRPVVVTVMTNTIYGILCIVWTMLLQEICLSVCP